MEEEQVKLAQALAELKQVVGRSNREVYQKLEEIESERDAKTLDLTAELSQVENQKKTNLKSK